MTLMVVVRMVELFSGRDSIRGDSAQRESQKMHMQLLRIGGVGVFVTILSIGVRCWISKALGTGVTRYVVVL
jgi:hypothetical protein